MAELPQCPPFFSDRDALTSVAPACSSTFPSGFSFLWGPAARGGGPPPDSPGWPPGACIACPHLAELGPPPGPHLLGKHGETLGKCGASPPPLPKLEVLLKAISLASCRSRLATCLRDDVTRARSAAPPPAPAPRLLGMTSARAALSSPVSHQRGLRVVWLP